MNNSKILNRQHSIDTLKCFLCFLVILLHAGFTGTTGFYISAFARIAVPLFFIITGYYIPLMNNEKLKKHIKKITYLTIVASLFYFIISLVYSSFNIETSPYGFTSRFGLKEILYWILVNLTPFAFHLWYFYALLYVLLIIYLARKFKIINFFYKLIPVLFFTSYLLTFQNCLYYRNFLFTGLPYVLIGCLFRIHENQFIKLSSKPHFTIKILIISLIGLILELYIYKLTGTNDYRDQYFFTLPLASSIFLLTIKNPNIGKNSYLALIGEKYSAYIYIMHVFFIFITRYTTNDLMGFQITENILYKNCLPFLIFSITLTVVFLCKKSIDLFIALLRLIH